jgi:hypothetical protein
MADITQASDPVTDRVAFKAVTSTAREWMCDEWGENEIELDPADAQDFVEQAADNGFEIAVV